jgi:hypothetical protein
MKKRSLALVAVFTVAIGLLSEAPALATYSVTRILLPNGAATFFSPFSGPAEITWDFNDFMESGTNDPNRVFTVRLKKEGTTVHTDTFNITPGSMTSPHTESFSWPAQSVSAATSYEVEVTGGAVTRDRTFTLKPHLVRITSINPNPFFPRITNGFKDTTNVTYKLEGSSNPVKFDIFHANASGDCCGTLVRHDEKANVVLGTRHYIWDGKDDSTAKLPVGRYFVRVTATAFNGQTQSSADTLVRIALYRRVLRTASQNGNDFVRRSPVNKLKGGGACSVTRDNVHRDALIACHDATVKVFWRWVLGRSPRIRSVSFRLIRVTGFTCRSSKGFTRPESWLRSGGLGRSRCRVDRATLSWTFLKPS